MMVDGESPSRQAADLDGSDSRPSKVRQVLARCGLVRKEAIYEVGQIDLRSATIETKISWIWRGFFRDGYAYFVSPVVASPRDVYIIERVERRTRSLRDDDPFEGYSGIVDGEQGVQLDALSRFNSGQLGERSALTVYGYWIQSSKTLLSGLEAGDPNRDSDLPPDGSPFAGSPLPDAIRRFDSEQAAYAFLENLNGEKIPARIRHLAWVAIAASTILWQWQDQIFGGGSAPGC